MGRFEMSGDAADPRLIPTRELRGGARIPSIGLGTFGSDRYSPAQVADAVRGALRVGYRFVDCAACYGNEREVGEALGEAIAGGLPREELFILSKVWNDSHAPEDVVRSVRKSLGDLRLGYLDCALIHWPFPNSHDPGCGGDARNPQSRPYIHEEFMLAWRALEGLRDEGLTRHIGVSNVTIPKLRLILRDARIPPAVCEMELHPCFQQGELFQYCLDSGVQPIGYSPLGSPSRPERDRAAGDADALSDPIVAEIARARGISPAQVCLKWAAQRGQIPIPFSARREQYLSNIRCLTAPPLSPGDMEAMRGVEKNCRLIKGQVFLWEGAGSWLDLWDVNGEIPGWGGNGEG